MPFGLLIPLTRPGRGLAFSVAGTLIVVTGIAMANIIIASFRQAYSPPRLRGRVTATMTLIVTGTSPLGALIAGALATAIGIRETLWIMFGITAVSGTVLLTGAIRQNRDLPTRCRCKDGSGEGNWAALGSDTARTGYQLRRALDLHAQAIRAYLDLS